MFVDRSSSAGRTKAETAALEAPRWRVSVKWYDEDPGHRVGLVLLVGAPGHVFITGGGLKVRRPGYCCSLLLLCCLRSLFLTESGLLARLTQLAILRLNTRGWWASIS